MIKIKTILITVGIASLLCSIIFGIIGSYRLENEVMSYWNLSDKSSTLIKKTENIDKFIQVLQNCNFEGKHNAIFLKTPNNSFDSNFEALQSLQQRLHEIKDMNVSSFEYQITIQQITGQEQGEACEMLSVFKGIWWKENYILLWNWIALVQVIISVVIIAAGFIIYDY